MARLLARILAVLALWLPIASHGLGLGEITLRSALNQPLEAEIELLALRPDEVDSVEVKLASNATFEQSGIDRTSLHSELRFKLQQKATGSYYIRAYTQALIKEPFLNFLVEVNWSAGRLVREYTVLLDPPNLIRAPAPRIQAPQVQSAAPSSSTPSTPASSGTSLSTPFDVSQQTHAVADPNNITQPRDTLWSLAQRLRTDSSVSTQQMMLALLEANPDAFFEHNINSLKAGYRLRVKELSLANEAIETRRQENEDLQSRLHELEGQVDSMQKLLSLKDENLANLQNKLEEIQPGVTADLMLPTAEAPPETVVSPESAEAAVTPPEAAGLDVEQTLRGLQDEFKGNLTLQAEAGGGALLLLALLWLIYRRRRVNSAVITEDDIYSLRNSATDTLDAEAVADEPLMHSIDVDAPEVATAAKSPLAEVDVYLAYEQYPQAESLLRQLIAKEPGNPQLKLRLLELFYLTKNKAAFGTAAENLHTALAGAKGLVWTKAANMGQKLYPDHPLFAQATPAAMPDPVPNPVAATENVASARPTPEPEAVAAPLEFNLEDEALALADADNSNLLEPDTDADTDSDFDSETDSTFDAAETGEDPYESADEVGTKLDLARAYLDMGDEEGATSILAEVLAEGSVAQKQEARDLMSNPTT